MNRERNPITLLIFLAVTLTVYSATVTIFSGDIGFDGDDWWVLGWASWHNFPGSIIEYGSEFLRPVEGVYWLSMFELFGFSSMILHFGSLMLLTGACILMGRCLQNMTPDANEFVFLAVCLAFFLPTVSCLTYTMFTDNSRLSMLIFWGSILGFQGWARVPFCVHKLILPIVLYLFSFLTYEAPSLLIFLLPAMVWPIHKRARTWSNTKFLSVVGGAVTISFGAALILRFFLLRGGVIVNKTLIPSLELIWSYFALLPFYLIAPFNSLQVNFWVLTISAVTLCCLVAIHRHSMSESSMGQMRNSVSGTSVSSFPYMAVLGIAMLILGLAPYQMAGYGGEYPRILDTVTAKWSGLTNIQTDWFNFNEASRIYSAGSFGIAIFLSATITSIKNLKIRKTLTGATFVVLGMMIVFHAGLSVDWQEAADMRRNIFQSLLVQAPGVKQGSNFVFLGLESYHKRAAVVRGWAGLRELMRLLYKDRSVGAWYVYTGSKDNPNTCTQDAIILPNGFASRGVSLDMPAPHNSLLVLKRVDNRLIMVDNITPADLPVGSRVLWRDCFGISSNPQKILACKANGPDGSNYFDQWPQGLAKTLGLSGSNSSNPSIQR